MNQLPPKNPGLSLAKILEISDYTGADNHYHPYDGENLIVLVYKDNIPYPHKKQLIHISDQVVYKGGHWYCDIYYN